MKATGDCYESAGRIVFEEHDDESLWRVVHGLVVGSPDSEVAALRYGHAWVERHDWPEVDGMSVEMAGMGFNIIWAIDNSNGKECEVPAVVYRSIAQATDVREYTLDEARVAMLEHETYGPWHHTGDPVPIEEGA